MSIVEENPWVDKKEQQAIELRRNNMLRQAEEPGDGKKYVFKSLLRQEYFNQRFKYKDLKLSSNIRKEI